ncbi:MAG TPA: potassium channel protein [Oscillospiraceae bacterium]|nr:potassium channel protein [Oscillospiraceae bacterium]HPF55255.1 potassium channel protein [Clostridiales bacterium]HPK36019.1 potassium channel protein [Oscillospiraceae bacterium]HPR76314.1 potassium channel protein [Oscillospiraceae bacterium]
MKNKRKFILVVFLLFAIIITGVIGYMLLLKVNFVDALYMTVITISTVGYGEVGVMTDSAKLFSVFIIFAGLSMVGYGLTSLVSLFFEGEFKSAWRRKRMETKIQEIKNHYIVCGAGDVGSTVINSLRENAADFVVIEENEKRVQELQQLGVLTIMGNATHEDILQKAGIANAKGLVCTLPTDAENVFTVLTARQMNQGLYIVSKAIETTSHQKLLRAGANKTISPNEIGGQRIASHLIRPSVISFLDVITRAGDVTLDLEEVVVPHLSEIEGKKLSQAKIPERTGLLILALKKSDEPHFKFNPGSGETLHSGDTMVVLGTKEQIHSLNQIINHT